MSHKSFDSTADKVKKIVNKTEYDNTLPGLVPEEIPTVDLKQVALKNKKQLIDNKESSSVTGDEMTEDERKKEKAILEPIPPITGPDQIGPPKMKDHAGLLDLDWMPTGTNVLRNRKTGKVITDPVIDSTTDTELTNLISKPIVDEPKLEKKKRKKYPAIHPALLKPESKLVIPVKESQMTSDHLPKRVMDKIKYVNLQKFIDSMNKVTLLEIVKNNTETKFLSHGSKFCYRLNYADLTFGYAEAVDNFSDAIIPGLEASYAKQHMNSISGEQKDLCLYTYSPKQIARFLENNGHNKYTFLPITVYPIDSSNGTRHDMLLIFQNDKMKFYWFDCQNRKDYLPVSRDASKNPIDLLLTLFAESLKLGYEYVPSEGWMIRGTLHQISSIGDLDFILSTMWCHVIMQLLPYYDDPIALMSALDNLKPAARFNLVYSFMYEQTWHTYDAYIPGMSRVSLKPNDQRITANSIPLTSSKVTPNATSRDENKSDDYFSMRNQSVRAFHSNINTLNRSVPSTSQPPRDKARDKSPDKQDNCIVS